MIKIIRQKFLIVKRFLPENDKTTNYIIEWTLYLIAAYNSEFGDRVYV